MTTLPVPDLAEVLAARGRIAPYLQATAPVVAAWADDAIHFHTGDFEQKFANLRANPHVILMTGCNTWDQGIDVMVEGDAVQVTDEDTLGRARYSR